MTPILAALLLARQTPDVTLDFTLTKGLIVAQGNANGNHPARVLIDTGARRTIVDAAFAKTIGLTPGEVVRVRGAGGTVDARYAKGLRLAGLGEGLEVAAVPLDALADALGARVDIILGQDVLASRVLLIDGVAGKVVFGVRPPVVTTSDTVLSLHRREGRPYLMATVVDPNGGQADAELLLDSGSDTTAELAQPYAEELGLHTRPDPDGRRILGVGGTVPLRVADVRGILVGRVAVPPQDVRVFSRPADSAGDGDGRVGNGFLSRFRATIDGPGLKLVLTPLKP